MLCSLWVEHLCSALHWSLWLSWPPTPSVLLRHMWHICRNTAYAVLLWSHVWLWLWSSFKKCVVVVAVVVRPKQQCVVVVVVVVIFWSHVWLWLWLWWYFKIMCGSSCVFGDNLQSHLPRGYVHYYNTKLDKPSVLQFSRGHWENVED